MLKLNSEKVAVLELMLQIYIVCSNIWENFQRKPVYISQTTAELLAVWMDHEKLQLILKGIVVLQLPSFYPSFCSIPYHLFLLCHFLLPSIVITPRRLWDSNIRLVLLPRLTSITFSICSFLIYSSELIGRRILCFCLRIAGNHAWVFK